METYFCHTCGTELEVPEAEVRQQLERLSRMDSVAEECDWSNFNPSFDARAARARWSQLMTASGTFERKFGL